MPTHADDKTTDAAATEANAPAVPNGGDHDRVVMLTLNPDGTPRQHNPELIGDRQFVTDAAKRQFGEQAVSAVDTELRGATTGPNGGSDGERDPDVLKSAHDDAQSAAHARAEATVEALHQGVGD